MHQQFSLRLAELLISRLCHDLVTPVGAINTGLELFQETSPGHLTETQEILNLILHSAQTASARLSLFRVAFGYSGARISLGEARQILENYFIRSKIEFQWKEPFQKNLTLEGWGRLLLNTVLWVSECAPRGGVLHISPPKEENLILSLRLRADPIILHKGTVEALEGRSSLEDLTPRSVPCYLIHCLVKENKGKLSLHSSSTLSELVLEVEGGVSDPSS
ncbi:MAG TPA: histidine phosphotransferase family protein [Alphaproteobacteria bacterium]|nr:histidine phosphotransferase family protein [Alphaproteobacteria bacterium]